MNGKILLVDDDAVGRAAVGQMLRTNGFEVIEAVDGTSALKRFKEDHPDLVLLDVVMPEPDGFEVCRTLKADPETRLTPVVLLTGLDKTNDRVKGIEAGADEFLSKPVESIELIARARSLLNLKRFTDALERAETVILTLASAIEARDPKTEGHCNRGLLTKGKVWMFKSRLVRPALRQRPRTSATPWCPRRRSPRWRPR